MTRIPKKDEVWTGNAWSGITRPATIVGCVSDCVVYLSGSQTLPSVRTLHNFLALFDPPKPLPPEEVWLRLAPGIDWYPCSPGEVGAVRYERAD